MTALKIEKYKPTNHTQKIKIRKPGNIVDGPKEIGVEKIHFGIQTTLEIDNTLNPEIPDVLNVFPGPDLRGLKEIRKNF
jgi:hypothetical protein